MFKKMNIRLVSCVLSAGFLVASAQADTFKLRVGSGHPGKGVSHMEVLDQYILPEIKARVESQTSHKITWVKAYSGTVAKLTETLSATKDGLLDVGVVNYPFQTAELFTHAFPFFMPFNTGDAVQATAAMRMTYNKVPWLSNVFEEKYNQKLLSIGSNGNYGVGTTFPFRKYADLKGRKVGAAGPNLELFRGSGMTPVNSSANEAYNALKSGIYNAVVLFPGFFQSIKLGEVAPHYTLTNIGSPSALSININLDTWKKLPADVQQIFTDVGREAEYIGAVAANKADQVGLEKLKKEGVKIYDFPFAEKEMWAKNLSDLPNEKAQESNKRGEPGTEVYSTYIKMLKKTGYVWPNEYKID